MNHLSTLRDQIAHFEAQNRIERDPDLREENKKTIRALHKELRKACRYRHPWHGIVRNIALLFTVFIVAVTALLFLLDFYGWAETLWASFIGAVLLTLATSTILLVTKNINQDIFKALVDSCFKAFSSKLPSIDLSGQMNLTKPEFHGTVNEPDSLTIFGKEELLLPDTRKNKGGSDVPPR
jgi:hypothetical protein